MNRIIPTVFATTKNDFNERFNKLIPVSKRIHIDFMDGKFVKSHSVAISNIPSLKKNKNIFEAHLMVENPQKYLKKLKQNGFKKIIFHYEALEPEEIASLIRKIKNFGAVPVLAINPETSTGEIKQFLPSLKEILVMGVHPGKEHQKFIPQTIQKIHALKKLNKKIIIQVDGGVSEKNIKNIFRAGADFVNSGSLIAESENPRETIINLNNLIKK